MSPQSQSPGVIVEHSVIGAQDLPGVQISIVLRLQRVCCGTQADCCGLEHPVSRMSRINFFMTASSS